MRIANLIKPALFAIVLSAASAPAAMAAPFGTAVPALTETSLIQKADYYYYPRRDCYRPYYRRHYSGYSSGYYRPYRRYDYDGYRPYYYSYSHRPRYYDRYDRDYDRY